MYFELAHYGTVYTGEALLVVLESSLPHQFFNVINGFFV